jgi:RNA polymerase sigma factor (sigma-70 family)
MKKFKFDEQEFESAINKLSTTIQASVQKIHPQKLGIEPDDLIQEIRIKLWKIFKSEKKISNHSSYIKKAINSIIIDQIRDSRRHERTLEIEKQQILQDYSYSRKQLEIKNDIGQAVNSLMESRRRVVKLFFLGLSLGEISAMLDRSESGTRNLLYRGLKDLKDIMKAKGVNFDD